MAETAALLVDDVLPQQPVRQWVLSLPFALRYLLATRPEVVTQVLGIVYRAISGHLIRKAGLTRASAVTGAVTLIQRFGSALNLNVHFHLLVLDGVYRREGEGRLVFVPVSSPSTEELKGLVQRIAERIGRSLERSGLIERDIDNAYLAFDPAEEAPNHGLLGSSITYRIATGPREGQKVFTLQTLPAEPDAPRSDVAESSGFSLHAGIAAKASQRDKVERLARYVSRPPVATERLSLTRGGNVRYALTNRQDCRFARPQAARRAGHRDVSGEHTVSRRHHARDFRTGGLHRATRCAGAEAPRAPDPLSRRVRTGEPRPGTDCAQRARYRLLLAWYFLRRWDEMDATVFASVPFVQLGNNLLHLPGHNGEISLPVAPNVVAASKRDYIAMPVGAFGAAGRLCSPNGYHFVGLSHF